MAVVEDHSTPHPPPSLEVPPLVGARLRRLAPVLIGLELLLVFVLGALVWHASRGGSFDRRVGEWLYAAPGTVVHGLFSVVSLLGLPGVAIALAVLVGIAVWFRFRSVLLALFCPLAVTLAVIVESIVKALVRRARPTTALLVHVHGRSFPSGHATATTALVLAVAILAFAARLPWRHQVLVAGVLYATLVALSRLVLGVHFVTDVVAGAALAGAVVLSVALVIAHFGTAERRTRHPSRRASPARR